MMPAECRRCGSVFLTRLPFAGNFAAHFSGNFTNCVRCGGPAQILDGTYELSEGVVRLLSGPEATVETLRAIEAALTRFREGRSTPAETKRDIDEVAPTFGAWLGRFATEPTLLAAMLTSLATIIAPLVTVGAMMLTSGPDANEVRTIVEQAVEQALRQHQQVRPADPGNPGEAQGQKPPVPKPKPASVTPAKPRPNLPSVDAQPGRNWAAKKKRGRRQG